MKLSPGSLVNKKPPALVVAGEAANDLAEVRAVQMEGGSASLLLIPRELL